ncbi:hypothetical protein JRQ81_017415 [Phrynocephalus forsythii]|uniref:Uncharacterized protein n=1 Tax=Phrynocephalus forsythii TaxID=171643 RepID=A0A9Q0XSR5_9SAUR|nr:hypothetical protein JRQ81_017415 [Phrynocephalus forsythii]
MICAFHSEFALVTKVTLAHTLDAHSAEHCPSATALGSPNRGSTKLHFLINAKSCEMAGYHMWLVGLHPAA